jgi:hypothetical protein
MNWANYSKGILLLLVLATGGCQQSDFLTGIQDAPTAKKDDRPQETGEGLPGYIRCAPTTLPQDDDKSGNLGCRLESDGNKAPVEAVDLDWDIDAGDPQVNVEIANQPAEASYHMIATFTGPSYQSIRQAMANGTINLVYQGQNFREDLADTYQDREQAVQGKVLLKIAFANTVTLTDSNWQTADSNRLNNGELIQDFSYQQTQTNWQLSTEGADATLSWQDADPPFSQDTQWADLANRALAADGSIIVTIDGLPAGSYEVQLYSLAPDGQTAANESQKLTVDIFRDGGYQRIAPEQVTPTYDPATTRIDSPLYFSTLEFEAIAQQGGAVQFRVLRLTDNAVPALLNAIVLRTYR